MNCRIEYLGKDKRDLFDKARQERGKKERDLEKKSR